MVYSATDAQYRALHLEEDLKAYYEVLSGFMEEQVDFKIFREEVENRRVKGMTMDGKFLYICRLINKCLSTSLTYLFFKQFFLHSAYIFLSPALACLLSLSPTKLPSPVREMSKFLEVLFFLPFLLQFSYISFFTFFSHLLFVYIFSWRCASRCWSLRTPRRITRISEK